MFSRQMHQVFWLVCPRTGLEPSTCINYRSFGVFLPPSPSICDDQKLLCAQKSHRQGNRQPDRNRVPPSEADRQEAAKQAGRAEGLPQWVG